MTNTNTTNNLSKIKYYSFFTKYSLLDDYGFSSGLLRRFFKKILPDVPQANTIEYFLVKAPNAIHQFIDKLDLNAAQTTAISKELDLSIKALCSKVIAFGLDKEMQLKLKFIGIESASYEVLLEKLNGLSNFQQNEIEELLKILGEIENSIHALRKNKHKIGTNLHLTIVTKRILEYLHQAKKLILLKLNFHSKKHWDDLFFDYITYLKEKNSVRKFISAHFDLLALEIVEHTSNKGEKYIAESQKEYWGFLFKSFLGGAMISIFALLKIIVDSFNFGQYENAFYYSLNYALCFILVKNFGGIIATKQPAMTASTIAKKIDKDDNLQLDSIQRIVLLIRRVSSSQIISLLGNFTMAFLSACLISKVIHLFSFYNPINAEKSIYLIKGVSFLNIKVLFFAAIAGVFLALSGLIAGYIDNKVVASKISYRMKNSKLFGKQKGIINYIEKKGGSLISNISLGFFLGSTFLLSNLLPFSIDIRHIAFSSANVGYAMQNYKFGFDIILLALSGVALIGIINFIVSFSITLFLTLKSRGVAIQLLPKIFLAVLKDFLFHPIDYFIVRK